MRSNIPTVSVILLTRNSAKSVRKVLDGIKKQKFNSFEVIVIDSESEDGTTEILKAYPFKVVSISPNDFGHGKTRNYAARLAKGEFIVFLSHDSAPNRDDWLTELTKPFTDPSVAGVFGRQIPREEEKLLDKYFQLSLYGTKQIIWKNNNWQQGDNLFSDANSALRRKMLLEHPYAPNIIVSEDYEWAARMLKRGLTIVYQPAAGVVHSHSYTLPTLFKRNFDVGVSYKSIYQGQKASGLFRKGTVIIRTELLHLKKSSNKKLIPEALLRDLVRFIAIQIGELEQFLPRGLKRRYLSAQRWYWK